MRKNRRKLHRELRLKAEARARIRALDRARERTRAARTRELAEAALRGRRPVSDERPCVQLASVRTLCSLAGVRAPMLRRVERVFAAVKRVAPGEAVADNLPWLLLLARPEWVRTPETAPVAAGSVKKRRDALASHLFAKWPVPAFLLRSLDVPRIAVARVPEEDAWAVEVLALVGRGDSLRKEVGTTHFPTPLTRKMVHRFLASTAETAPITALRRAQVWALGGEPRLASLLLRTRLGELRGPDLDLGEAFWQRVIGWLAGQSCAHLDANALDAVLGWVEAAQRNAVAEGTEVQLTGRTLDRVRALADEARILGRRRAGEAFPVSGIPGLEDGGWAIREIGTPGALVDEGLAMQHCAASYRHLIERRKVALFSLTWEGQRRVTVEVSLGAGRVVQTKRLANAAPLAEEAAVIQRWARAVRLRTR